MDICQSKHFVWIYCISHILLMSCTNTVYYCIKYVLHLMKYLQFMAVICLLVHNKKTLIRNKQVIYFVGPSSDFWYCTHPLPSSTCLSSGCRTVAAEVRKQIAGQYGGSPQLFKNLNVGTTTSNTVSRLHDLWKNRQHHYCDTQALLNCLKTHQLGVNNSVSVSAQQKRETVDFCTDKI